MIYRVTFSFLILLFAFGILFSSVLRSASVKYAFSMPPHSEHYENENRVNIVYDLPHTGSVGPGDIAWPLEVARDKFWLTITTNPAKKSEILSLLADKRLVSAEDFFNSGDAEMGMSTIVKAEKYFEDAVTYAEIAKDEGMEVSQLLEKLAYGSLKHREVLEECLLDAPEDAKPFVINAMEPSKRLFDKIAVLLIETRGFALENPYNKQN